MAEDNSQQNQNPLQYRWDFTQLFQGDDDERLEQDKLDFIKATNSFADKWRENSEYLEDPVALAAALQEYEALEADYGEPASYYYFWLRSMQEQDNPKIKAKLNELQEVFIEQLNKMQFFELNLAKVDPKIQKNFLKHPDLQDYRHFLEKLFAQAPHLLSDEQEQIMNLKSDTSHSKWVKMTQEFLSKETVRIVDDGQVKKGQGEEVEKGQRSVPTKEVSFAELVNLLSDKNQQVRDDAAAKFNNLLRKHLATAEAEVNAILANKKVNDNLRNYGRPDKARHVSDDIETEVVDALVEAVSKNFDLARSYYSLKASILGKERLAYHERNVAVGEIDMKYTYPDAVQLVQDTFADLDPEFAQIAKMFVENKRVDVYPRQGKSGGAFCAHGTLKHPVYVLLNYHGELNDVLTIAHEFGHGINDELMRKACHALDFGTSLATAEVASTFMEDFVLRRLLEEADDEQRFVIIMQKLNDDISTIHRQVACYRFEQQLHKEYRTQNYLSSEYIGNLFKQNMQAYMGDSVEQSPGSSNWWVYWSHIRSFFYVYSYASGLLISKSLQARVHQDPTSITEVKKFLSAGLSKSPKHIFEEVGVNITKPSFWEAGLAEVKLLLDEANELAQSLGYID